MTCNKASHKQRKEKKNFITSSRVEIMLNENWNATMCNRVTRDNQLALWNFALKQRWGEDTTPRPIPLKNNTKLTKGKGPMLMH